MNSKKVKKTELIAPAGDWSALLSAVESGADSVYFGVKGINMRQGAGNFEIQELEKVMNLLRDNGKKGYLALNVVVYDEEEKKIKKILKAAAKANVDAVILCDMAVLDLAKEFELSLHLSTQANVSNFKALKHYYNFGVERVVLARECTLDSIKRIIKRLKREKIKCEIETFIHGAMCVSISGRCFLSHHTFFKSANRGECIQPCRREYEIRDAEGECEYVLGKDYVLSPKDLCTIQYIDKLIAAGISAFKIEGRIRPPEYVKVVTSVYRQAIDAYFSGELTQKLKEELYDKLKYSFNRGFGTGFYLGMPDDLGGVLEKKYEKVFLGEVVKFYKKIEVAEIVLLNGDLAVGQKMLITGKKTPAEFFVVDQMQMDHKEVKQVNRGSVVAVKVPFNVRRKDKVFLWIEK